MNSTEGNEGVERARQWPDRITSGEIRYSPSDVHPERFILRDAMHGIPVFGSVKVEVFNYPGQTEDIAKALCDRWNAHGPMLEALQNVKGFLDTPISRRRNDGDSFYSEIVASLNAAIAKAEGSK